MLAAVQSEDTYQLTQRRKARECQLAYRRLCSLKALRPKLDWPGESPYVGAALTHTAIALHTVLPHTLAALSEGVVSEYHARLVAQQTNHLADDHRRAIDAPLPADWAGFEFAVTNLGKATPTG